MITINYVKANEARSFIAQLALETVPHVGEKVLLTAFGGFYIVTDVLWVDSGHVNVALKPQTQSECMPNEDATSILEGLAQMEEAATIEGAFMPNEDATPYFGPERRKNHTTTIGRHAFVPLSKVPGIGTSLEEDEEAQVTSSPTSKVPANPIDALMDAAMPIEEDIDEEEVQKARAMVDEQVISDPASKVPALFMGEELEPERIETIKAMVDRQVPSFSSAAEPAEKEPEKIYERISWFEFHTLSKLMARYLKSKENGNRIFIAVTRDGLFPAGIISHILEHRLVDTICVTSRSNDGQSTPVQIIKKPDASWVLMAGGANLVFIDAISDTGRTAEAIKTLYPACTYVVMVAKEEGIAAVDYYAHKVPDASWVLFPWDNDPTS